MLGGPQVSPSTMWHACVRPSDRYFLVHISTHKESLGKVAICAHNREDTGLKERLVLVSNAAKCFKEMIAFHVGFICCRRTPYNVSYQRISLMSFDNTL